MIGVRVRQPVFTEYTGEDDPSLESNEPPYATVYFIMKKANRELLKYDSPVSIKTAKGLFLSIDSINNGLLRISRKAVEGNSELFILERAPKKDGIGVNNQSETHIKYGDPIYIKSKATDRYLVRPNEVISSIGNGNHTGTSWDNQAFKFISPTRKSGYIEQGDSLMISNFNITSSIIVEDNANNIRSNGNDDLIQPEKQFTIKHINREIPKQGSAQTLTTHSTAFEADCNGNSVCFDKHKIKCPIDSSLTQFNLVRSGARTQKYNYTCKNTPYIEKTEHKSTPYNDECGGNAICLDRHHVNCEGGSINSVRLARGYNKNPGTLTGNFRYEYTCNNDKLHGKTTHYTPWRSDGNGDSAFLDQHNIQCPVGKVLTDFHLERKFPENGVRKCSQRYGMYYDPRTNEMLSNFRIPQYDPVHPNRYGKYYFRQYGLLSGCERNFDKTRYKYGCAYHASDNDVNKSDSGLSSLSQAMTSTSNTKLSLQQVNAFNIAARKLQTPFYMEFTTEKQDATHKKIIYKRLTPITDWNFFSVVAL